MKSFCHFILMCPQSNRLFLWSYKQPQCCFDDVEICFKNRDIRFNKYENSLERKYTLLFLYTNVNYTWRGNLFIVSKIATQPCIQ